ncbi:hypothetical protein [Janibacter terrae]|uniref:hypothetical protein n=1 Tax=Janibacter terrae TaxID=103817 RepID=UPI0031F8BFBB
MSDDLRTPEQLAARYGKTRRWVLDKARTSWPHIEVGRTVRFTAEQVAAIDQMQTVTPEPSVKHAEAWGRRTRQAS